MPSTKPAAPAQAATQKPAAGDKGTSTPEEAPTTKTTAPSSPSGTKAPSAAPAPSAEKSTTNPPPAATSRSAASPSPIRTIPPTRSTQPPASGSRPSQQGGTGGTSGTGSVTGTGGTRAAQPSQGTRSAQPTGGAPRPAQPTGSASTTRADQRGSGSSSPSGTGRDRSGSPSGRPSGAGSATGATSQGVTGERHRRSQEQRLRQSIQGGGRAGNQQKGGATPPPPQPVAPIKFTPEQLKKLRDGVNLHKVREEVQQQVAPPILPLPHDDDVEDRRRSGHGSKDRDKEQNRERTRLADRARRSEQRKVKTSNIIISGGEVDIIEESAGSRRGRRAALLKKAKRQPGTVERKGKVPISLPITVRSLSEATGLKAVQLLLKLKDLTNSLFTINSNVDVEVAELIASDVGVELDIQKPKSAEDEMLDFHDEEAGDESKLEPRAPVVTIMGHVDHGKTTLLDSIRKRYGMESDVVSTEAGGITQVIRAWRVEKDGKPVTFLDTPGHEAFTKMRARGANVTDIAVIVVAADSGVQPQTEEAISHAKAAGVSIVIAINKIDMPGADPTRVERQLYSLGVLPDTMGGDAQFVRVSAIKGTGIDELLETLSLVAEIKELKANPHKMAQGVCLEAYLSDSEGVMATLLVQQGTLHRGDTIVCGAAFGRVRAMYDDLGRPIDEAKPSVPVRVTGLDEVPNADDHFHALAEYAKAREIAEKRKLRQQEQHYSVRSAVKLETLNEAKGRKITELKIILKAEARGSVEAIRKELEKLVHDEVRVRVLHAGIGAITESDVELALTSPEDSMVIGFNVTPDDAALRLAEEKNVPLREYNIIYKLTEDIKAALEGKLKPEERVIHLGRAVVRQTFKISKVGTIAGCYVTQGTIERNSKVRLIREGVVVYPPPERTASLESLKRFKDDVREVKEGYDCGMKIAGFDDLKVGDVIEAYRIEQVQRTL
ncbi:MAG: translation initiation factor IF-2 [Gemmataceae bacterium]|nr:translation initiation factor IF-2 [Gemmataceae bacterium]